MLTQGLTDALHAQRAASVVLGSLDDRVRGQDWGVKEQDRGKRHPQRTIEEWRSDLQRFAKKTEMEFRSAGAQLEIRMKRDTVRNLLVAIYALDGALVPPIDNSELDAVGREFDL